MAISDEAKLLEAIKTRLESITIAGGYPVAVRTVIINYGVLNINVDKTKTPLIEVVQGPEEYQHGVSGQLTVNENIFLRVVMAKGTSDVDLADLKACIIRCLFADTYAGQTNDGIRLDNYASYFQLVRCESDVGLVDANRIFSLQLSITRNTATWRY